MDEMSSEETIREIISLTLDSCFEHCKENRNTKNAEADIRVLMFESESESETEQSDEDQERNDRKDRNPLKDNQPCLENARRGGDEAGPSTRLETEPANTHEVDIEIIDIEEDCKSLACFQYYQHELDCIYSVYPLAGGPPLPYTVLNSYATDAKHQMLVKLFLYRPLPGRDTCVWPSAWRSAAVTFLPTTTAATSFLVRVGAAALTGGLPANMQDLQQQLAARNNFCLSGGRLAGLAAQYRVAGRTLCGKLVYRGKEVGPPRSISGLGTDWVHHLLSPASLARTVDTLAAEITRETRQTGHNWVTKIRQTR